jgi:hypothetical protein
LFSEFSLNLLLEREFKKMAYQKYRQKRLSINHNKIVVANALILSIFMKNIRFFFFVLGDDILNDGDNDNQYLTSASGFNILTFWRKNNV